LFVDPRIGQFIAAGDFQRAKILFSNFFDCDDADATWILNCTDEQFKTLCAYIAESNGRFATCNPVLTSVTGSNTAIYVLGSTEVAKAVLFYLVKYLTKTAVDSTISVAIVAAVVERNKKFKSVADDAETTERNAKLFVSRSVNLMYGKEEVPVTQAACFLLDLPFNQVSEKTFFLFIWAYVRHYRFTRSGADKETRADESHDMNEDDTMDESDGANFFDIFETQDAPPESFVETTTTAYKFGNCTVYDTFDFDKPVKKSLSSEDLYLHRGAKLQCLSPYEYVSIVEIVKRKVDEEEDEEVAGAKRGPGRPSTTLFEFEKDFALSRSHVQKWRSKQIIPVLAHPPCRSF
jgi:hypothetical protein